MLLGFNMFSISFWYSHNGSCKIIETLVLVKINILALIKYEGEKNHKKGGLNCVFGNFFFNVLDDCPQVQSLK